jgi:uncharacterized protein YjiS (DUF1127 family)
MLCRQGIPGSISFAARLRRRSALKDGAATMSQSYSIREPVRAASIVAAGRTVLARWTNAIVIWLNRRQGRRDLCALDDRLLADIGISREDALWKAGKPFWRTEDALRKAGEPFWRA